MKEKETMMLAKMAEDRWEKYNEGGGSHFPDLAMGGMGWECEKCTTIGKSRSLVSKHGVRISTTALEIQSVKEALQSEVRDALGKKNGIMWEKVGLTQTHFLMSTLSNTKLCLACQNDSEVLKHVLQKGESDMWSISAVATPVPTVYPIPMEFGSRNIMLHHPTARA